MKDPVDVIFDRVNDSFIISDRENRRIVRWSRQNGRSGEIIVSNIHCACIAMDNDGYLYINDLDKQEVKRYKIEDRDGVVVAGGNGEGNRLD